MVSSFMWIPDLFRVLGVGNNLPLEKKAEARRLVGCWAHIASQLDYNAKPEDEQEPQFDPNTLIESLAASVGSDLKQLMTDPKLLDDYDSEDDDDYNPEDDEEDDEDEDDEDDDPDDEEEDGEKDKVEDKKSNKGDNEGSQSVLQVKTDDLPPLENVDESSSNPIEKEIQNLVFATVKSLGAYMPDPDTDIEWFKRVLKDVRAAQITKNYSWYPFGCPPMKPIIDCLRQEADPFQKQMAASIILLFQSQVEGANIEET
eukprot:TRINITY_DN7968_c0_g1_i14.p1 TRINITY_DN7968_c0_g1~~TRINITY_DN7968_c0_g1_i14.p1  ORF type:complete len:258 (+),score=71.43 TRINITY_DN7968_c0_g1_i14:518-1291(+)